MTMMEMLLVVAIFGLMFLFAYTNWKAQLQKGFDNRRKTDMYKIQTALEHYVNDHGCYPDASLMLDCTSSVFASYGMPELLCDPESKEPYYYELVDNANACKGYYLYTYLKIPIDPDIDRAACPTATGCCCGGSALCNYGVSSGANVNQCAP